ncbi:hypothetical protein BBJ29_000771 [Phytophthora kernoviae]|uniref:ATPase dynein-related AAA domain-containing protein n=1 Tax=Phytophthora kernoviae TaxID=325452 RepID=A0A3F2RWT4_9STRA|nr:hypothetical protein BBJ29_000771 [Phytophthora kernoviae]RLN65767.1 hypothetical protein BBP00_00002674 [Phytophthora kernoviae]
MPQELLGHLRWMLQKDLLKQDMFLIGPPGSSRRLLSMRFCELLNKEVEYIAISQDTTESDLKQRREIVDGAAIFTDQAPVRAAINGRVLVIDVMTHWWIKGTQLMFWRRKTWCVFILIFVSLLWVSLSRLIPDER